MMIEFSSLVTSLLSSLLQYVVPGFIFLELFCYIKFIKISHTSILVPSVCASYLIQGFSHWLERFGILSSWITASFIAVIAAYFLALFVKSKAFSKILLKIKIDATPNFTVWQDIRDENTWIMIYDKDCIYYGYPEFVDFQNPQRVQVVLTKYSVLDSHLNIIKDYTNDDDVFMLFDLSQYPKVKFIKAK